MKLMKLFSKLTPEQFAQIQVLLKSKVRTRNEQKAFESFLEKICSDTGLEAVYLNLLTVEQMLVLEQRGVLDTLLSGWILAALKNRDLRVDAVFKIEKDVVSDNLLPLIENPYKRKLYVILDSEALFISSELIKVLASEKGLQALEEGWFQVAELRYDRTKSGDGKRLQNLLHHHQSLLVRKEFPLQQLLIMSSQKLSSLEEKKESISQNSDPLQNSETSKDTPLVFLRASISDPIKATASEDSTLKKSLTLVSKEQKTALLSDTGYFKQEELRQFSGDQIELLSSFTVLQAIQDGRISVKDRSNILKLAASYPTRFTLVFSIVGIRALNNTITLEQIMAVRCEDYFEWLLTPHAQNALIEKNISVDFIAKIWFSRCKRNEDVNLVEKILSLEFLERVKKFKIDFMALYEESYQDAHLMNGHPQQDIVKIKAFLYLWTDRIRVFSLIDEKKVSENYSSPERFFRALLQKNKKELEEIWHKFYNEDPGSQGSASNRDNESIQLPTQFCFSRSFRFLSSSPQSPDPATVSSPQKSSSSKHEPVDLFSLDL